MAGLQFAPWSSDIELSFYSALASLKIDHDKLNDAARQIVGRYHVQPNDAPEHSARLQIHGNAFAADNVPVSSCRAEGIIRNVNTIEDYKNLDRAAIMDRAGQTIWDAILDGTIYSCPSLLSSFHALFFADLKKYRFTYHFAFPALHSTPTWRASDGLDDETKLRLSTSESAYLYDAVQTWRYGIDDRQRGFFLAKRSRTKTRDSTVPLVHIERAPASQEGSERVPGWTVGSLADFEQGFFTDVLAEDRFVCFVDPSTYPRNPAWMLRNLLVLVRHRWKLDKVQILCYRDSHSQREKANSLLLRLETESELARDAETAMPKVTGWERNDAGKLGNRTANLAEYMDQTRLADQSVDLNLKLMKWRIAPDLDLDVIKNTKCLLLGAGTLGSYVSRNLLGWGVRKVTFVDNGKVSFSNPVRQPLFAFRDCIGGGAKKATRAAEVLKEIYPGVDAQGHVMSGPMAGHPVTDEVQVKEEFDLLKRLIDEHDAIFLLMDSRESRWLPTVMGKAAGKIVLNAALGFDTYVVMRHGATISVEEQSTLETEELGCYFCNDVVAPSDSQKDATLDQQCTVTRPGVAPIASALLVELLVSILQHPHRQRAGAPIQRLSGTSSKNDRAASTFFKHPLGLLPHTIRGQLSQFENLLIKGHAYECCSACSPAILDRYRREEWVFVRRACDERGYVEEVSGLAEVQRQAEAALREIESMELEDEGDEGGLDEEGELL